MIKTSKLEVMMGAGNPDYNNDGQPYADALGCEQVHQRCHLDGA